MNSRRMFFSVNTHLQRNNLADIVMINNQRSNNLPQSSTLSPPLPPRRPKTRAPAPCCVLCCFGFVGQLNSLPHLLLLLLFRPSQPATTVLLLLRRKQRPPNPTLHPQRPPPPPQAKTHQPQRRILVRSQRLKRPHPLPPPHPRPHRRRGPKISFCLPNPSRVLSRAGRTAKKLRGDRLPALQIKKLGFHLADHAKE